jgi:hypothetical protein
MAGVVSILQLLGQVQVLCAEMAQPAQLAAGQSNCCCRFLLYQLGQQVRCQHVIVQLGNATQEGRLSRVAWLCNLHRGTINISNSRQQELQQ